MDTVSWPAGNGRFDGRVAFITGGASGIGRATALRLAREGAAVMLADLDAGGADDVVSIIRARGGTAAASYCNVSDADSVRAAFVMNDATFGRIDILANVAGIGSNPKASVEDISLEQMTHVLAVNLIGAFLCTQEATRRMKLRRYGRIVNVASIAASVSVTPGNSPYGASKGGLIAMTRHVVNDVSAHGITINAVAPGITRTPLTDTYGEAWLEAMVKLVPVGRLGDPDDIASAIAFLAAEEAGFVTGHTLVVDGGTTSVVPRP